MQSRATCLAPSTYSLFLPLGSFYSLLQQHHQALHQALLPHLLCGPVPRPPAGRWRLNTLHGGGAGFRWVLPAGAAPDSTAATVAVPSPPSPPAAAVCPSFEMPVHASAVRAPLPHPAVLPLASHISCWPVPLPACQAGMQAADFARKQLNLVVVLDVSGSMGESFDQYYYDGASSTSSSGTSGGGGDPEGEAPICIFGRGKGPSASYFSRMSPVSRDVSPASMLMSTSPSAWLLA